ncbi:hypothetical protein [Micromonospora sp. NPDC005806]|uniref:hypothetical protein n=1 Tax=Micromonospora sp. NPDC005806 TaxID=3364234 RepID=UPI0036A9E59C
MEMSVRARIRDGDPDAFRELFDGHVRTPDGARVSLDGDRMFTLTAEWTDHLPA